MFKATVNKEVLNGLGILCQLSGIKCTGSKRSVLALTSLAAEDDVSRFS
jgi:hypothetical protein